MRKKPRTACVIASPRLATVDLRLSVLLIATDAAGLCRVSSTARTVGVVHGTASAQLDRSHAQRIIGNGSPAHISCPASLVSVYGSLSWPPTP